jgi:transposase
MTPVAQKISLSLEQRQIEAYQLSADGQIQLLFTHRQIGEAVGKTKEAAQRFLKQQSDLLSEPLKAKIPEKPHPVPLTPLSSAKAYWKCLAQKGNETAIALIEALDKNCLEELPIISPEEPTSSENANNDHSKATINPEFQLIVSGIETASKWMEQAGVDKSAIAHWKLTQLSKEIPQLTPIITSAQSVIANSTVSPSGMIASQLASQLTEKLDLKVTAASVNKALHELGLQEWSKPGQSRERKLTDAGKQYGVSVLATSADGWQGCQIRWNESVIELLVEHLSNQLT